jgi:hypothetical protein
MKCRGWRGDVSSSRLKMGPASKGETPRGNDEKQMTNV